MPERGPTSMTKSAISWSAGKDSFVALLRAREAGLAVTTFVTFFDPDGSSKSHALPQSLVAAQVLALGGDLLPVVVSSAVGASPTYADVFDTTLAGLRRAGHTHVVFGDIDLAAHRDWLEPRCREAGLVAAFPLWDASRSDIALEVIERGIRARVVGVDTRWLDASFCGADYDDAFLARLPAGVCPCGEDGEFHTFVWNGPGFTKPLGIRRGPQRRVESPPPFAPTTLIFETPILDTSLDR